LYELQFPSAYLNLGLILVDIQNRFVSKGGSYDKLGMNTGEYRKIIPAVQKLLSF
jgi:ureidoacrylate peracid hydrolase